MYRDDLSNIIDDGIPFKKFCPNWKTAVLWKEWTEFGFKCFSDGQSISYMYTQCSQANHHSESISLEQTKGGPKTNTDPIPIVLDESGYPELPDIRMDGNNKTKIVQSMLRDYCTANMRQSPLKIHPPMSNIYSSGFVTGKKKALIPWGALVRDPSSFINEECTPNGFEWKDPSKIRIGEVFRLLYHWRHRKDQGLLPLVWVPTCSLFQDMDEPYGHTQKVQHSNAHSPHDSEEDTFILPSSGEFDEDDHTDRDAECNDSNEPEDNHSSPGSGEPNDQDMGNSAHSNSDQGDDSNDNASDCGEPDAAVNMESPPMNEPYIHGWSSGMCPHLL